MNQSGAQQINRLAIAKTSKVPAFCSSLCVHSSRNIVRPSFTRQYRRTPGRPVVRNIMPTGTMLVCSVVLDDLGFDAAFLRSWCRTASCANALMASSRNGSKSARSSSNLKPPWRTFNVFDRSGAMDGADRTGQSILTQTDRAVQEQRSSRSRPLACCRARFILTI